MGNIGHHASGFHLAANNYGRICDNSTKSKHLEFAYVCIDGQRVFYRINLGLDNALAQLQVLGI